MTEAQREIMMHFKSSHGAFAVKYMKGTRPMYRILTRDMSLIFNAGKRPFCTLISNGMINVDKSEIPSKYTLSDLGLKYKIRKSKNERTADTI